MAKISPLVLIPPLAFAALGALFFFGLNRDDPSQLPSAYIGQAVPEMTLEQLGANTMLTRQALTAPGVKLVNFWASWCGPCRVEHPRLVELAAAGIPVYGINYKDQPEQGLAFLAELGNPYEAVGADSSGRTGIDWGIYGVPETFVIDSQGRVVARHAGPLTRDIVNRIIMPAIEAAE
ncbi:DsbE family thiol:disulfide interchange protein [Abyssibius alkaniclasticus]|uniref:DsbE family thiol:disulfide interchange protein n=1 Tax=Abyssibius alkaniclasticus TaxID=2881234 RepID=UPI002363B9CA|nr:DsbE family thiol:disulfide interchange protein [Abyssibius alkaniclasticus]UPH70080.1 DsbE family thiol:disulfide interchange protein [Abyssibius alkaniclasticus]|tara:strand:- start:791 stop:1324 length:534 start_codon:yes stop_codon:yes gene_type:complete